MENKLDLVVIGSGPAGYVAAIYASKHGLKVACVEKYASSGGVCLNVGCIPSKALLESSMLYENALTEMGTHGISMGKVSYDLDTMLKRKEKIVKEFTRGIDFLFKKNKVKRITGTASFVDAQTIEVTHDGSSQRIQAKNIIIATGSKPIELPFAPFDGQRIISSTHALSLKETPQSLIVIGGGVIGLEMGSVWSRLGSEVTVIEMLPSLVGGLLDDQVHRLLKRDLAKKKINVRLSTKLNKVDVKADHVELSVEDDKGKSEVITGSHVLVGVGRKPNTADLQLANAGIELDQRGRIAVDSNYETTAPGVYAVGDVIAGPMLAHKASEEGVAAVEVILGEGNNMLYNAVPSIVYTWPEIAWVGYGERELKEHGIPFKTGSFPFQALGRARTMEQTTGLIKVFGHAETDHLLGAVIYGAHASELITEYVLAIEMGAKTADIAKSVHGHPTLSEGLKEAALGVSGFNINA